MDIVKGKGGVVVKGMRERRIKGKELKVDEGG